MNSIISVTVLAPDRALLAPEQLRVAAGMASTDSSRDTELAGLGLSVSDIICDWCRVAGDGVTPTTLRKERLVETFRLPRRSRGHSLTLGRRFLGDVTVLEDDVALDAADFLINAGAGTLTRLRNDHECAWWATKIVVTYEAGFEIVPGSLQFAAEELTRIYWFRRARDPALKQISIPDVIERQYWVDDTSNQSNIPQHVMDILERYRNDRHVAI